MSETRRFTQDELMLGTKLTALEAENERLKTIVAKMWRTDAPFITPEGTTLLTVKEIRLAAELVAKGYAEKDAT